ncbi:hypothetical protein CRG98_026673 [Punica granatum]|uniref:Uncharacterized protein n=1 Tax=Punica granatum TaxID=22663 RepID=A0A2I0J9P6_PUNGR|nr:hypothetical protein CRG98_026673 [Punica granatum]
MAGHWGVTEPEWSFFLGMRLLATQFKRKFKVVDAQREAETLRSTARGSRTRGSLGRVEVAVKGPRVAAREFVFVWSASLSRGLRLVKIVKMKDERGRVKVETGAEAQAYCSQEGNFEIRVNLRIFS